MIGDLNLETGVITWRFRSLDPATLELPDDPDGGFLPPNQNAPEGEGFVTYIVRPKEGSPTGTRIDAQARIVFDVNEPIDTPAIAHTLDAGTPSASVNALPERTIGTTVNVSWAGADDAGGSGVGTFDVFVSDNGGPFVPFLLGTTDTSAVFTGEIGHTYEFLAVAIDNVGHRQPRPADAQARTTLVPEPLQVHDVDLVARQRPDRQDRASASTSRLRAATAGKLGQLPADRGRPGPAAWHEGRPGPVAGHGQVRSGNEHGPAAARASRSVNGNFFHLSRRGTPA